MNRRSAREALGPVSKELGERRRLKSADVERPWGERPKERGKGIVTGADHDDLRAVEGRKRNQSLQVGDHLSNREREDERRDRGRRCA
jgi:hypothetical protein